MEIKVQGLLFSSNFDSGNLARVEYTTPTEQGKPPNSILPDLEFNLWTKVDAADTEFQNNFRSWFYFSVKGSGRQPTLVKFNVKNLNRHSKVFTNHMYPVYMVSGQQHWQKIKDKPSFADVGENAVLTFIHRIDGVQKVYFALCYPYPYRDIISFLSRIDKKYSSIDKVNFSSEDIYYYRECLCYSLEGRRVDLITITSIWGISREREPRLKHLFPNSEEPRPHCFPHKKVIFITGRVHPAETSSNFVLDGIITSLINKEDPGAALLRRKFIFKLIPVLNPDGVVKGHYRTDSRGVNLNRVYQDPSLELHPSIYAACAVIRYYHQKFLQSGVSEESEIFVDGQVPCPEKDKELDRRKESKRTVSENRNSGLFLYLDLHSHASRKGFFIYGNHFPDLEDSIETRIFAKLMEINCKSFSYDSCDFTEASMHLKDKTGDGSRDGTGRVWVMREMGLTYSYTFETHYNTGRVETCIPRSGGKLASKHWISFVPSEFATPTYEGVGRAILQSIMDLNGPTAWSRLHSSSLKSLSKIRESLQKELSDRMTYRKPLAKVLKPVVKAVAISSVKKVPTTASKPKGAAKKSPIQLEPKTDLNTDKNDKTKLPEDNEVAELTKENNVSDLPEENEVIGHQQENEETKPELKIPVFMPECNNLASGLVTNDNMFDKNEGEKPSLQLPIDQLERIQILDSPIEDTIPKEDNDCCPPL